MQATRARLSGRLALAHRALAVMAVLAVGVSPCAASFTINLNFGGGLTASQQAVFNDAKALWEDAITGYGPGIGLTGVTINASGIAIDGAGGTLGQAGPTTGVNQGGFILAATGIMQFDTADLASLEAAGTLAAVIAHEMGHVLGIGTLWTQNGVYVNGTGEYTGANALAEFRDEFNQPDAEFIPVELDGGPGTADAHWDELSGIVDDQGRDFTNELLTGFLNAPTFLSRTTIASLMDIGFLTVLAVPEPGTFLTVCTGILFGALRRRRTRVA